jgi:hypothetical protein
MNFTHIYTCGSVAEHITAEQAEQLQTALGNSPNYSIEPMPIVEKPKSLIESDSKEKGQDKKQ